MPGHGMQGHRMQGHRMKADRETFVRAASALVGPKYVLTGDEETRPYRSDWRGRYQGPALAVVMPGSTSEVSGLVGLCAELGLPIVPQAGNTGLTGGSVPAGQGDSVIVNVSRMKRIRSVDRANSSLAVDAGCILADIRAVADEHDRLFPMLLSSVGSCEIGGLISTNAGGTGVLRYGTMRDMVLGLEVVLPDGRVWDGMRALRKDNSGYDLKQLFIGAEGTLGIVTGAVLKLQPKPTASATAMCSLRTVQDAVDLLELAQGRIGNRIEAFELMSHSQLAVLRAHRPELTSPLPGEAPFYILMEIADSAQDWNPETQLEGLLEQALERDLVVDATIAADLAKANRIWELRHSISEANKHAGFAISNDTSVPVSRTPDFIARVTERLDRAFDSITVCHCGHIGDGNIHVIAVLPRAVFSTPDLCERGAALVNTIVHEESVALGGSISAEHGIGSMHVDKLPRYKSALELELMGRLKAAFDPTRLMNPGKILPAMGRG